MNVPLVPMHATKCVIAPPVCSKISTAVPSIMRLPVRRIVVLIGIEIGVGILLVDFAAQPNRSVRTLARIGKNHLRAVSLQDLLALMRSVGGQAQASPYSP